MRLLRFSAPLMAVVLACVFYAGSAIYTRKFTEDTPGIMRRLARVVHLGRGLAAILILRILSWRL
jgi:hypothetical protein